MNFLHQICPLFYGEQNLHLRRYFCYCYSGTMLWLQRCKYFLDSFFSVKMRYFKTLVIFLTVISLKCVKCKPPNILLILADDLGKRFSLNFESVTNFWSSKMYLRVFTFPCPFKLWFLNTYFLLESDYNYLLTCFWIIN